MRKSATRMLWALILAVPAWADEMNDGRIFYEQYACARCHGADAKTPRASDVPRLAGMAADRIEQNVRRFVENRAHQDVLGGCGAPPTAAEIRKIARYLTSLPP